jgi:beta-phosphoglucomutase-like phosphatase (HAD superfamily)
MKAMIFDLDGTLVDSVYAHVLAWQLAFAEAGLPIDGWRLHRRMGMSGGLFKRANVQNRSPFALRNRNERVQIALRLVLTLQHHRNDGLAIIAGAAERPKLH